MGTLTLRSNENLDKVKSDVERKRAEISKEHPEFISRCGDGNIVSTVMQADVVIQPIKCAAGIQELPFMLLPRSDNIPPEGYYRLKIEDKYRNNNPFCENAPCTNIEFMLVFAMAFKLLGFLADMTVVKEVDELLYERDCCLLFTYMYFDLDYSKLCKVA